MRRHLFTTAAVAVLTGASLAGVLTAPRLRAQSQAPDKGPTFEVASVKANNSGFPRVAIMMQGDRYTAINVNLRMLIRNAYQLQDFQMAGGPSWIDSDRFDVVGKLETVPPPPGQLQSMLRALLADRFKLVTHNETKELPIYALALARSDGKLGPRLTPSTLDCAAMRGRAGGPPPRPPQPGERPPCGVFFGPGRMTAGSMTMAGLAQALSPRVNRVVVDRTGLAGNFDLEVEFTPEPGQDGRGGLPPGPPGAGPPPVPADGPSIFTAVQEQLGLKLESARGPVDMLVIDRIDHPTED